LALHRHNFIGAYSPFNVFSNQILFEDTIISVKQDYKVGQRALTVALNTIKD